ncbi:hypothetical protein ScPMuIL_008755, partial [Solemya velum]
MQSVTEAVGRTIGLDGVAILEATTGVEVCGFLECMNGGLLQEEDCSCHCADEYSGLLCETERQKSSWPAGPYALPTAIYGCPEEDSHGWNLMYINLSLPEGTKERHRWNDDNIYTVEPHLLGPYYTHTVQMNFCVKDKEQNKTGAWSSGQYCIYRAEYSCPAGFEEGNITMHRYMTVSSNLRANTTVHASTDSLTVMFCCRSDGDITDSLALPNTFPFYLMRNNQSSSCQTVEGMDAEEEVFYFVDVQSDWEYNEQHPHIYKDESNVGLTFCFYRPKVRQECVYRNDSGFSYNGQQNTSRSGKSCMFWADIGDEFEDTKFWTGEFEDNFCRKFDNSIAGGPVCYVNTTEYEDCGIMDCVEDAAVEMVVSGKPVYTVKHTKDNFPEYLTDGDIGGVPFQAYRPMVKPYIQVNLEVFYEVYAVQVHRMYVWYPVNLRYAAVYISSNRWDFLNYGALQCNTHHNPRKAKVFRFQCMRPISGQYVTLRNFDLTDSTSKAGFFHYLEISEIIIYAKKTGCGQPLGLVSGEIRDFQISASTEKSVSDHGRLLNPDPGWCSTELDNAPYIMVDLITPMIVQGIIVQGWEDSVDTSRYIKSFSISYGVVTDDPLIDLTDTEGAMLIYYIDQSIAPTTPQKFYFPSEILARIIKVSIVEFSEIACLKMELIGCPKRVVRDLTCANGSLDWGWEEQARYGLWMEPNQSYTDGSSIGACRLKCSEHAMCSSIYYDHKIPLCNLLGGHRYNRHYFHWWMSNLSTDRSYSQHLCIRDVTNMESCGGLITGEGILTSPAYPFYYGQNLVCHWDVELQESSFVQIEVLDIGLAVPTSTNALKMAGIHDVHVGNCQDTLIISSSNSSRTSFTSQTANRLQDVKIISYSNRITVSLQSCNQYSRTSAIGFVLNITVSDHPGCGIEDFQCHTTCEAQSAYIATVGFPVRTNVDSCYWHIQGIYTQYVELIILHLDVPNVGEACTISHVSVYDIASNGERHLLDRFCNTKRPYGKIESSWHELDVEFQSGSSLVGTGFMAVYSLQTFVALYNDNETVVCEEEWMGYGGNCYRAFSEPLESTEGLMWKKAEVACLNKGGHLVSIGSEDEMSFIHFMMTMKWEIGLGTQAFIGLHKKDGKDLLTEYKWSDGKPLSYTAWFLDGASRLAQPDGLMNERCTVIWLKSIHSITNWHDIACAYSKVRHFICEKEEQGVQLDHSFPGLREWSDSNFKRENVFGCGTGEYIARVFVCDGAADCEDGSDERQCGDSCPLGSFMCENGNCISVSFFCDFVQHCNDGSDEQDCVHPDCRGDQWMCDSGQCISITDRCNLKTDCSDLSDEEHCEKCPSNFQCYDEKCIPMSRVCDGHVDCDGKFFEDEDGCSNTVRHSCADWWAAGMRDDGKYIIDAGDGDPFPVVCNFHGGFEGLQEVTTIVHHESEEMFIHDAGLLDYQLVYSISLEQIVRLKAFSDCKQFLQLRCHYTHQDVWWIGANSQEYHIYDQDNCTCNFLQLCALEETRNCWCNMRMSDWFSHDQNDWLTDSGYIISQESLPIISVYNSNVGSVFLEKFAIVIGPLLCTESRPGGTDKAVCKNGVNVDVTVQCVLDYDQYGEVIGCRDLSHLENCAEHVCERGYVKCPGRYCIPVRLLCDGVPNCPLGEDELSCGNRFTLGYFSCHSSSVLLPTHQVCDGIHHCPQGDDENLCHVLCPVSCDCNGLTVSCLGSLANSTKIPPDVRILDLSNNIQVTENFTFSNYSYLAELNISSTGLVGIYTGMFQTLNNLRVLDLSYNLIEVLSSQSFTGLLNLRRLHLHGNKKIYMINPYAFYGLRNLPVLEIQQTQMTKLSKSIFEGLSSLKSLNMSNNMIYSVEDRTFEGLDNLHSLDLSENMIEDFSDEMFSGLNNLTELHTDSYMFCCLRPKVLPESRCFPYKNEFSSCSDLMRNEVLRISLWVVGTLALIGNFFVLVYRGIFDRHTLKKASNVFVTNLALSDFLMGVYLLIIASADTYFRGIYIWKDATWRKGAVCKLAGIISTLSTESTIMFLCMITIDRVIAIKFPFGHFKMTGQNAMIISAIIWIIFMLISVMPVFLFQYFHNDFYSHSPVCLALPLTNTFSTGWEYSTSIFIIFNCLAFLFIAGGQAVVYRVITDVEMCIKSQRKSVDLVIARNLFIITFTDFLCWFPICVMGIMAMTGYQIPGEVYVWTAVFILPVNSAINPFLYTIGTIIKQHGNRAYFHSSLRSSTRSTGTLDVEVWSEIWMKDFFITRNSLKPFMTLKVFLQKHEISAREAYSIVHKVAEIVHFLHSKGMPHGNINEHTVCVLPDQ